MIQIDHVRHQINGSDVLHDVSLTLPKDGITAIIGPNGAGKSTLLNLVARLDPLRHGAITVDGLDVSHTCTGQLARKMAIVTQRVGVASRLQVRDLVSFGRWPHHHGRPGPEDHAAVEDALQAFELTDLGHRFLDELSGGQAQRAFVAMGYAQGTDWLLLDEPLNHLDMYHARALMRRVHALSRPGPEARSVVLVVHDINYAAAWADHIVALKQGRVFAQGSTDEVVNANTLSALYDMEIAVHEIDGRRTVLHHA